MSYGDEWLKAVRAKQQPKPTEPVPVESTTWKPWSKMSVEERRKALSQREDATPRHSGR